MSNNFDFPYLRMCFGDFRVDQFISQVSSVLVDSIEDLLVEYFESVDKLPF